MTEDNILDILFRIKELEKSVRELKQVYEFNLENVPLKYRKAFPKEGEDPFFRPTYFRPKAQPLGIYGTETSFVHLNTLPDAKERESAKKRMLGYANLEKERKKKLKRYKKKGKIKPKI